MIYPLFFIAAAYGLVRAIERRHVGGRRWAVGALLAGLAVHTVVLICWVPDQIGYRNAGVRGEPGYVINDSDLDWGQDLLALRDFVERNQIEELYLLDRGSTNPCRHGFPTLRSLTPGEPVTGWLAVFERPYWLNRGPVRKHLRGAADCAGAQGLVGLAAGLPSRSAGRQRRSDVPHREY